MRTGRQDQQSDAETRSRWVPYEPDAAQLTAVKAVIASAATLAEVGQLEEALAAGQVPAPMQTG